MKILVPVLVAAFVAAAFTVPAEKVTFHVEPKTKVSKTFDVREKLASKKIEITVGGEDAGLGEIALTTDEHTEIHVVDEYATVADGRPTKFTRLYEKLATKSEQVTTLDGEKFEDEDGPTEFASALEGKHVAFTWDADESAYERAWGADDKGDDDLLEHLDADLDALALLPKKSVADGDTWDVDVNRLRSILLPGGDLSFRAPDDEEDGDGGEAELQHSLAEHLKGKLTATFRGAREEGGVRVGVVEIAGDVTGTGEAEADGESRKLELSAEVKGELRWNLAAGRLERLEITCTVTKSYESVGETEDGEQAMTRFELAGEQVITARAGD